MAGKILIVLFVLAACLVILLSPHLLKKSVKPMSKGEISSLCCGALPIGQGYPDSVSPGDLLSVEVYKFDDRESGYAEVRNLDITQTRKNLERSFGVASFCQEESVQYLESRWRSLFPSQTSFDIEKIKIRKDLRVLIWSGEDKEVNLFYWEPRFDEGNAFFIWSCAK